MGILSGIKNAVQKNENIEKVAAARKAICDACYVCEYGKSRFCKLRLGGCGCVISLKIRSLDDECPLKKWQSVTEEEINSK